MKKKIGLIFLLIVILTGLTLFKNKNLSTSDSQEGLKASSRAESNLKDEKPRLREKAEENISQEMATQRSQLPLSDIFESGDLESLKAKIKKYPNLLNQRDEMGNTPLLLALDSEDPKLALFLLEQGANPNVQNKEGLSATALAVLSGNENLFLEVSKLSKESNPDLFAGKKALNHAALNGSLKMVKTILGKVTSQQVNHQDDLGQSPLYLATLAGHFEVASLLVEAGADPNLKNHEGLSAKDIAIKEKDQKLVEIFNK